MPVAYSRVFWDDEEDGRIYKLVCFVDPAFGGRGIGSALLAWNEARLREIAADHDVSDEAGRRPSWRTRTRPRPRSFAQPATSPGRTWPRWSGRPSTICPTIRFPTGWRSGRCARRTSERSGKPTSRPSATTGDSSSSRTRTTSASSRSRTTTPRCGRSHGTTRESRVRSSRSSTRPRTRTYGRQRGWTEAISTARRWRRRGVAKALIVESIRELAARGMTEVALGVHTENPNGAYQLYESLGYEVVQTWTTYRKPL